MLTKQQARGAILGYYILYRVKANPEQPWENKTVDGADTTSYVVAPLNEFTLYQFAMQAFNSKGASDPTSPPLEKETDEHSEFILRSLLQRFSIECRKTKAKVTTTANQNKGEYHKEPMRTQSKYM